MNQPGISRSVQAEGWVVPRGSRLVINEGRDEHKLFTNALAQGSPPPTSAWLNSRSAS